MIEEINPRGVDLYGLCEIFYCCIVLAGAGSIEAYLEIAIG